MGSLPLHIENIYLRRNFKDFGEYIDFITQRLEKEGLIKKNYKESILEREKVFPTGLDTGSIKVAIPHTDHTTSNTTAIILTTLETPVLFRMMDDPEKEIPVQIIIHILFDKAEKQLEVLENLMKILKNQEILQRIISSEEAIDVYHLLIS